MKGKGKKQACKKKTDVGAKESKQKDRKLPDKKAPARWTCKFCRGNNQFGRQHCPAWGAYCSSCGKDNNFIKCYQSTNRNRTHGVREEYEESSGDADDINKESSSESDYIVCMTLTSNSISTVEHCENAQEIYADPERKSNPLSCRLWGNFQCAACKVCRTRRD